MRRLLWLVTLLTGTAMAQTAPPISGAPVLPAWHDAPLQGAWSDRSRSPDARADALVKAMTRDERLMLVFGYFGTVDDRNAYIPPREALEGSAGYVPGVPRLGFPAQYETDAGIGVATQGSAKTKRERTALPSGIATAATWDPAIAYAGGAMIGAEARASGFNVMLGGGANLLRDPRNGRNFEYGGEDPLLAGTMVGSTIAGIQSNRIISTIKHYAVNDQETDRDTGNSAIDPAAARMSDLFAFQIAIERGAPGSVMCSYNKVNGTHACENRFLLTDVLRRDWGYRGYVMSDWGGTHSTAAAANAGLEQDSGFPFDGAPYFGGPLRAAVANGAVSEARLEQMAQRIARSFFASGAVDDPVKAGGAIDYAAHARVTRADATAAAVLLKNDGALLPLARTVRSIAVIGGHADKGVLAGSGSSLVYPRGGNAVPGLKPDGWPGPVMYYPSSPLEAIRRLAPDAKVRFADGGDPAAAAALARDSDVAIVFGTQWAGESFDVPMALDGAQDRLIDAVTAANPRTVAVLETNGPVAMPWVARTAAVLEAWYPGTEGGEAIADLLFGRANPLGHLPATFPTSISQLPRPAAPAPGEVRYHEGATVGYKWFDAKGLKPLFPFGHGLSYTSFALGDLKAVAGRPGITASFTVRNTGPRAGAEVAQVYVGRIGGGWEAPKRLGGFAKVMLTPGSSASRTVTIDPRLLAIWNDRTHGWRIAGGRYRVMLARSAEDIVQTAMVTVPPATLPADWRPSEDAMTARPETAP